VILARIKGDIVSTHKFPCYQGHKIMIVQPVDENGDDIGSTFLSCDTAHAGPGDVVLVEQEGNCARQLLGTKEDPFHSVIVGIVDQVTVSSSK
jgi:microcompartment protein CcmK/EutM